jgi:hypothetical protein
MDLHEHEAEPVAITWGTRTLYDRAAIVRVWQACRPELEADIWRLPAAPAGAGRCELRPPAAP